MHDRDRDHYKNLDEEQLEKIQLKIKKYREIKDMVLKLRAKKEYTHDALKYTEKLLEINPDFLTVWNYRREILLVLLTGLEPKELHKRYKEELGFNQKTLAKDYKSYGAWHHRVWIIQQVPDELENELKLCKEFLKWDERNFHCWNYRRYIVQMMSLSSRDELAFNSEKINENFSNYSAWHNRAAVITSSQNLRSLSHEINSEFELAQNAFATEPEDQSTWIYYYWLLNSAVSRIQNYQRLQITDTALINHPLQDHDTRSIHGDLTGFLLVLNRSIPSARSLVLHAESIRQDGTRETIEGTVRPLASAAKRQSSAFVFTTDYPMSSRDVSLIYVSVSSPPDEMHAERYIGVGHPRDDEASALPVHVELMETSDEETSFYVTMASPIKPSMLTSNDTDMNIKMEQIITGTDNTPKTIQVDGKWEIAHPSLFSSLTGDQNDTLHSVLLSSANNPAKAESSSSNTPNNGNNDERYHRSYILRVPSSSIPHDPQVTGERIQLKISAGGFEDISFMVPLQKQDSVEIEKFKNDVLNSINETTEFCDDLLEVEPDSKWVKLSQTLASHAKHQIQSDVQQFNELTSILKVLRDNLPSIDTWHPKYYKDLASRYLLEHVAKEYNYARQNALVKKVDLSNAMITRLSGDLTPLCTTQVLDLTNNHIASLLGCALTEMSFCVRELILDNNDLTVLRLDDFVVFPHLEKLSLKNNKITKIIPPRNPKTQNKVLQKLDLSGNPIIEHAEHCNNIIGQTFPEMIAEF